MPADCGRCLRLGRAAAADRAGALAGLLSPPYTFYVDRRAEMVGLITRLMAAAPAESGFVVESDERFDFGELPDPRLGYPPLPPGAGGVLFQAGPTGLKHIGPIRRIGIIGRIGPIGRMLC